MPRSLVIITPKDLLEKTAQLAKEGPIGSAWSEGLYWLRFQPIGVNRVREEALGEAVQSATLRYVKKVLVLLDIMEIMQFDSFSPKNGDF